MDIDVKIENKLLATLGADLLDDISVSLLNVREKSMLVSTIRAKWVMKYFKEKEVMKKLSAAKNHLIDIGVGELQTSNTANRSISKMRLAEQVAGSSDKVKQINKMVVDQAEVIQFMEYALNIVSDFNFTVKHVLDALKLEQT